MDISQITTLLLDVDNTLLDFDEAERQGVCEVMRRYGVEPTAERIALYHEVNRARWEAFERGDITRNQIFECRYPQFFEKLGISVTGDAPEKLYRRCLDGCAAMIPGAEELCRALSAVYELYIITNGVSATQYRRLAKSGLDRYFMGIFVSEDAGSQKPQAGYFDYCFARIREKDKSRMLVIGDSLTSDIRGGINAGVKTVWVNRTGQQPRPDIRPDAEVHSLAELQELLTAGTGA